MIKKKFRIEFAPGAFDSFEGTQAELDEVIAQIEQAFAEMSEEELNSDESLIDLEQLADDDPELYAEIVDRMNKGRTLQ